ncbi:MAG TPA: hypothetical protein VEH06_16080 [Candidatus Bathyarchaeia archaeon]|nr:hypothetical protein [Candidatus Bathyarchaeia archaeon]
MLSQRCSRLGEKSDQYGVFLLKPSSRTKQAAIALRLIQLILPGQLLKREARSASELDEFDRILSNQKLVGLARKIDQVNPKQKEATSRRLRDISQHANRLIIYYWCMEA